MDDLADHFERFHIVNEAGSDTSSDYDDSSSDYYEVHPILHDVAEAALYGNINMNIPGYARPTREDMDKVRRRLTF